MKKRLFILAIIIFISACSVEDELNLVDSESNNDEMGDEVTEDDHMHEFTGNADPEQDKKDTNEESEASNQFSLNFDIDLSQYANESSEWGEFVSGVKTELDTDEQVVALTFDACGGPYGSDIDEQLIEFLIDNDIPATLFINKTWIEANADLFMELASTPLFQIENHGTEHVPLSIDGKEAWGIKETSSHEEIVAEVVENHQFITNLTGKEPTLFRSGTAFYDEVAVEIVNDLGVEVVNFNILGDAGGTYSSEQVKNALLGAQNGSIALLHMNQPNSGTAQGVIEAVPLLQEQGFEFVLLEDYDLK